MLDRYRWWAVIALALASFMAAVDINIVVLALPPMAKYFQAPATSMPLVTFSYSIAMVLFLLPVGQWITRFRPLTIFLIATIGFSLSSVSCGLSQIFVVLLVSRVIQGVCAAFMSTTSMALTAVVVAPSERGKAMGILGGISAFGSVVGSALGGFLVNYLGWQSVFFINVPLCIMVALLGIWSLRELSREQAFGDSRSSKAFTAAFTLLQGFRFSSALLCVCCFTLVGGALYFLIPFDMSLIQHLPSSVVGIILLCLPLTLSIFTFIGGPLVDRYGTRPILLIGLLVALGGLILDTLVLGQVTSSIDIAWRLLLIGGGLGLFMGAVQPLVVSLSPKQTLGLASALLVLSKYLGLAIGPLVVSAVWLFVTATSAQMVYGSLAIVGVSVIGILLAWLAVRDASEPALSLGALGGNQERNQGEASLVESVDTSSSSQEAG